MPGNLNAIGTLIVAGLLLACATQGEARVLLADAPIVGAPTAGPGAALAAGAAPGAAPAAGPEQASITNVVEASAGEMTSAARLMLTGVSPNVAWVVSDSGGRATGRYPTSKFVGAEFVKGGSWLGSPQAAVHATNKTSGNDTTLVLLLSGPVYNKTAGTLAFNVTPAAAGSKLRLAGGAADSALANAQAVNLRQPAAGLQLTDVSLFIDDSGPPGARGNAGEKASSTPLTGQLVDQRNVGVNNPDSPRYAATNGNGNGFNSGPGLINAGSAYYGYYYPWSGGWYGR